jgi:hypothetical protein
MPGQLRRRVRGESAEAVTTAKSVPLPADPNNRAVVGGARHVGKRFTPTRVGTTERNQAASCAVRASPPN